MLEKLIAFIAPSMCVGCGAEGADLCSTCLATAWQPLAPCCLLCGAAGGDLGQVCTACSIAHSVPAYARMWAAAAYDGLPHHLVHAVKFEGRRSAAQGLAGLIASCLPELPGFTVTTVPTAPPRVRERGYDHARLVGRAVARTRKLSYRPLLARLHDQRQVGSDRAARQRSAATAFYVPSPALVRGRQVLLIDDVCTTGASLLAAMTALRAAGADTVHAAVAVWQPPVVPHVTKKEAPA